MKKVIGILMLLMLVSVVGVEAGDEYNPEIKDDIQDHFGPFGKVWKPVTTDIFSGWIQDDEQNVYMTLKVVDFRLCYWRQVHSIHFSYMGIQYSVGSHTSLFGYPDKGILIREVGRPEEWNLTDVSVNVDDDENTYTWTIPRDSILHLEKGGTIYDIYGWTCMRTPFELTSILVLGELVKDSADAHRVYVIGR